MTYFYCSNCFSAYVLEPEQCDCHGKTLWSGYPSSCDKSKYPFKQKTVDNIISFYDGWDDCCYVELFFADKEPDTITFTTYERQQEMVDYLLSVGIEKKK